VISAGTLLELLDQVPPRYRALLLLATFASLRFGELAGLRLGELDLETCSVQVAISTAEMDDGRLIDHDPKSRAGRRMVAFPKEIAPELRWHVERFAQAGDNGLVFIGPKGGRLRRSNFRRIWTKARNAIDMPELHFHDLRHTGNTMAAGRGRKPAGADGKDGSLKHPGRADLPASDPRARPSHRRRHGQGPARRQEEAQRRQRIIGTQRARGRNRAS
jgi:integrase